jgi:sugar lactone lactonase YvrE
MKRLLLLLIVWGCDDGDGQAVVRDMQPVDAQSDQALDAARDAASSLDARATMDAAQMDAARSDAAPADATVDALLDRSMDARPLDAVLPDVALPDAAPPDAMVDAALPDAVVDAMPMPACGEERLPVRDIRGTEGLAITADGTVFYSQPRAVGRRRPGQNPENAWVQLPDAGTVWGVAWRASDATLFVATPSAGGRIYAIDTRARDPQPVIWMRNAGAPNGLIIGPDDRPYYSDFGGGGVYRLDGPDRAVQITQRAIQSANGLLFNADGSLFVLSYRRGEVVRLSLDDAGMETGRVVAHTERNAALDGIARDARGRLYLSDNGAGTLLRFDARFGNREVLAQGIRAAANIIFGRGAIDCAAVYVASSGALGEYIQPQ